MSTLEATRTGTEEKSFMEDFMKEQITWIKGLREAGVSADKAAEVSKDIMIALLNSYPSYSDDEDEEEEYEDEDYEEE